MREFVYEFWCFGIKQAYACLFGGILLALILATKFLWPLIWPDGAPIARYDFLFFAAIITQLLLVALKLETRDEVRVIFIFHIVGTVMELFKTYVGSWAYPEENIIRLGGVPLFSGFMYSAVGSYIARVWRIFDFKFTHYPPRSRTALLCVLIYINFFSHHYLPDIRYLLFAAILLIFGRTRIYYRPYRVHRWMPLIVGFVLVAFFIWIAENSATFGAAWIYPNQEAGWNIVSIGKMGSWFLLMIISFVLVTFIRKPEDYRAPAEKAAGRALS